jgi:hypothetical protein
MLFRLRFWRPHHWLSFRIAFPVGFGNGQWYDIVTDSHREGHYIRGVMLECVWPKGKKPSAAVARWETSTVVHV